MCLEMKIKYVSNFKTYIINVKIVENVAHCAAYHVLRIRFTYTYSHVCLILQTPKRFFLLTVLDL